MIEKSILDFVSVRRTEPIMFGYETFDDTLNIARIEK